MKVFIKRRDAGGARTHPADPAGAERAGGHVREAERGAGWVVEETPVERRGEEAHGGAAVRQGQSQQAAHVQVQVVPQSCAQTHTAFKIKVLLTRPPGEKNS